MPLQWEPVGQLLFLCASPFLLMGTVLVTLFGIGAFCNWLDHRRAARALAPRTVATEVSEPLSLEPQPQPQLLRG